MIFSNFISLLVIQWLYICICKIMPLIIQPVTLSLRTLNCRTLWNSIVNSQVPSHILHDLPSFCTFSSSHLINLQVFLINILLIFICTLHFTSRIFIYVIQYTYHVYTGLLIECFKISKTSISCFIYPSQRLYRMFILYPMTIKLLKY